MKKIIFVNYILEFIHYKFYSFKISFINENIKNVFINNLFINFDKIYMIINSD